MSGDRPRWLTSYAVIYHSSSDCHLYLLWCGYFMLNWYWYSFYTYSLYALSSSLRYSPSWPPQHSTVSNLLTIPHHCCGILQLSCTRHWGEPTPFKIPHKLKLIPSAVHSVLCGIFLILYKRHQITSLFSSYIDHSRFRIYFLKVRFTKVHIYIHIYIKIVICNGNLFSWSRLFWQYLLVMDKSP